MSPPVEPMSVEDLSSIYRKEKKGAVLSEVRRDLYRAMANLVVSVNKEYERQVGIDPDSLICEGADQRRKKVKTLVRDVVDERMRKVAMLALRGSMGADNNVSSLTSEERDYYSSILTASKRHMGIIDELRGAPRYTVPDITGQEPAAVAPAPAETEDRADVPEPVTEPVNEPIAEEPQEDMQSDETTETPEAPAVIPANIPDAEEDLPMDMGDEYAFEDDPDTEIPDDGFVPDEATVAEAAVPVPAQAATVEDDAPADVPEHIDADGMILLRMLDDMPPFSGPTRDYTLMKEDIVLMPSSIATVLINREKAVIVRPTP